MKIKTIDLPCAQCGHKNLLLYMDPGGDKPTRIRRNGGDSQEEPKPFACKAKNCGRVFFSKQAVANHYSRTHRKGG